MNRQRLFSLLSVLAGLVMLLTLPLPAIAQIEKGTLWRDAVITELDVDFGAGFHARWRFHRCDCGDLQVMVEQVAPDAPPPSPRSFFRVPSSSASAWSICPFSMCLEKTFIISWM